MKRIHAYSMYGNLKDMCIGRMFIIMKIKSIICTSVLTNFKVVTVPSQINNDEKDTKN